MKKLIIVAVLLVSLLCTLPVLAEQKLLDFSADECGIVEAFWYVGMPFAPPYDMMYGNQFEYNTSDKLEVNQIIDLINSFDFKDSTDMVGTTCGPGIRIEFPNVGKYILIDGTNMKITVVSEDTAYITAYCSEEEYNKLWDMLEDMRTKDYIKLYFNDELIKKDVAPVIINDRTLVAAGVIRNMFGTEIEWNKDSKTITFINEQTTASFTAGESFMLKNGEETELDSGCCIIDGYLMIPVRVLSEFFGCEVLWKDNSVYIYSPSFFALVE